MELEKLGKLIDQWKGLLAGIGLLLGAIVTLQKALIDLNPRTWSWAEITVAAVAIVLLGVVTVRSRKAHVSRLVDPDALKMDPQSPEQLVGRRQDLNMLLRALANPLVFLVSESGCGKSALLRAGVAQGPAFTQRFLPIYIDMSVLDWEDGPLRAVREGFAQALPNDDPAQGKLDARTNPRQYAEAFGDYYRRTQRRPLLLLDQFDDYQAEPRHRERFLPPDTRVWRNAASIAGENAFWRMLRQCLQSGGISVIVACREDAAQGLESLRFHPDVPQFDLPWLEPGLVRLIIDRLTERPADKPPVIAEPLGGWTTLRDRLVDDLEARGQVLPQQLKVALGGLRTLYRLTPVAYARAGRLAGLEAASVAGAITRAARIAALRDEDVLRLLLPLVDRTRQPPDKGPPKSQMQLAATAHVPDNAAGRALERLEADEVVRAQGELQGTEAGWQLDHAYLAQPLLRIERERDLWHQLLAERARSYAEASWRDKWGALLPLGLQARLIGARLQRRFRYGEQSGYALRSLSRELPAVLVLGVIAGLSWAATEWDAARQIEGEMAGNGNPMSGDAAAGLAELAGRGWVTRWRVARDIFSLPQDAEWFASAPGPVVRAWVRLDPDRLDNLVRAHVTPESLKQTDPRLKTAADALVGETSLAALADGTKETFERVVSGALSNPATAARGAPILVEVLTDGDPYAAEVLAQLRQAIGKTEDFDKLNALVQAYAAAAGKLKETDPHAAEELTGLREAIGKTAKKLARLSVVIGFNDTGLNRLEALTRAYAAMKGTDPHAAEFLAEVREAIGKTTDSYQLDALAQTYAAVANKLKEADLHAPEELVLLRDAIGKTTDSNQLRPLAQAYAAMVGKLKEADPHAAEELAWLRREISETSEKLASFRLVPGVMTEITTPPERLEAWAQAYAAVKGADPNAAAILTKLREAMDNSDLEAEYEDAFGKVYAAVASKLKEADLHAAEELVGLREAIGKATDPAQLDALATAYAAVKGNDVPAAEVLAGLRKAIGKNTDSDYFSALAQAYARVAGKLIEADPHAAQVLAWLREAIGKNTTLDRDQLDWLVKTYGAVAGKLKEADPHAAEELAALREAIGKTSDLGQLDALAKAYEAVAGRLKKADPHAAEELAALREAIGKNRDLDQLSALAQAYAAVIERARPATAPVQDIGRIGDMRSEGQVQAFSAAILAALRLGTPPLTWDQAGLVVTAALLQPISAGKPTRQLVNGYEDLLRERANAPRPEKSWSGDVWAFANWARGNLPGFDPYRPKVGFLPSVALDTRQ